MHITQAAQAAAARSERLSVAMERAESVGDVGAAREIGWRVREADEAEIKLRAALATVLAFEEGQIVFGVGNEDEEVMPWAA